MLGMAFTSNWSRLLRRWTIQVEIQKPSIQDIESTKRAVEAGRIVGVEILDRLVIGDKSYVSLKEKGYM